MKVLPARMESHHFQWKRNTVEVLSFQRPAWITVEEKHRNERQRAASISQSTWIVHKTYNYWWWGADVQCFRGKYKVLLIYTSCVIGHLNWRISISVITQSNCHSFCLYLLHVHIQYRYSRSIMRAQSPHGAPCCSTGIVPTLRNVLTWDMWPAPKSKASLCLCPVSSKQRGMIGAFGSACTLCTGR